jgi:uncharacterized protein
MIINRAIYGDLLNWKSRAEKMPLILKGARQVGKTFIIKHFAKEFSQIHEFNFQKNTNHKDIFKNSNDPQKIIRNLEISTSKKIDLKTDLIFFDEIQDCPEALNSLKYFCEDFPNAHVIAAGSLLGVYLSNHSFPVGKVEFLELFPLSFFEFLNALHKPALSQTLLTLNSENNIFHQQMNDELKKYFILGGMPKVVRTYIESDFDFTKSREIQEGLIQSYKSDFAKYSGPVDALKILAVFESIPKQLAKENKKFQLNILKTGARLAEFKTAIDWLVHAGLCYQAHILSRAEVPLKSHVEDQFFKIYFFDIGLLAALADLPISAFSVESDLFKTFKGAFVENYFLQEFRSQRKEILYNWQSRSAEVDFVFQKNMQLCPIEIKSGESGKLKSLSVFCEKYNCKISTRSSMRHLEIRTDQILRNIPLYLAALV